MTHGDQAHIFVAVLARFQSTPGSSHHGVLLSRSRFCRLRVPSSLRSSNSSSLRFLPPEPPASTAGPLPPRDLEAGSGSGDASKLMKSS